MRYSYVYYTNAALICNINIYTQLLSLKLPWNVAPFQTKFDLDHFGDVAQEMEYRPLKTNMAMENYQFE